jgi:hypothetical protein
MNEPVTTPAYTLPTDPAPKTGKVLLITAIVLLFLVVGAAVYAYVSFANDFAFRGVRYLAGSFEERALYELNWMGEGKEVTLPAPGRVIDYDRSGNVEAAILLSDAGQQVYLLEADMPRVLVPGAGIRSSLAVSPDGTRIAYAERITEDANATPLAFYDPASWEVHVVDIQSGDNTVLGTGYAPQFFVRDGTSYVLYTTSVGVTVRNLSSDMEQVLTLDLGDSRGLFPVVVTEDGQQIALPSPGGVYKLHAFVHDGTTFTLEGSSFAPKGTTILAFDDNELVTLSHPVQGSLLSRSGFDMSEEARVTKPIPVQFITKIIP